MNKTIVALFIPSYHVGGAEKVLILLANSFLAHYDEVHMLSVSSKGLLQEQLDPAVKRIDFDEASYKRILFKLRAYYETFKPDAVVTSLYATGIVACAARFISRHKPVLLIGAHNSFSAKLAAPDNVKDKYLLRPLSSLFFSGAEAIVSVSRGVSDDLANSLRLPAAKLHVIYNPVVSRDLLQKARMPLSHRWLGERSERPYKTLLTVGRLVEQKAYDVLLNAFARLPNRERYRLVIVGDGPLAEPLKILALALGISGWVDFVGYDMNPYRYMAKADLFVMSSIWEGLGNVLIEAMACGCPVVATDCPYGPSEILESGTYGYLAPLKDPQALADAIVSAFQCEKASTQQLALRANEFTDVRASSHYVSLINKLLTNHVVAS